MSDWDTVVSNLKGLGLNSVSINDMLYEHLTNLGYPGALQDKIYAYQKDFGFDDYLTVCLSISGSGGSSAPINTSPPVVSGTGYSGQTLTTTDGTWSNSPTGFTYQWQSDSVDISGATATTYQVTDSTEGTSLSCLVTASNPDGSNTTGSNVIHNWVPTDEISVQGWYDFTTDNFLTLNSGKVSLATDRSGKSLNLFQNTVSAQPTWLDGFETRAGYVETGPNFRLSTPTRNISTVATLFQPGLSGGILWLASGGAPGTPDQNGIFVQDNTTNTVSFDELGTDAGRYALDGEDISASQENHDRPLGIFPLDTVGVFNWDTSQSINGVLNREVFFGGAEGAIRELVFFSSYSTDLKHRIEGYLAHRNNAPLVNGHPYKDNAPTV